MRDYVLANEKGPRLRAFSIHFGNAEVRSNFLISSLLLSLPAGDA
jgi:hypothetical protein